MGSRGLVHARMLAAGAIVLAMVALQWTDWMGSSVEPVILGIPVQFSYFIGYAGLSVIALWGVFRLIWPPDPSE